MKLPTVVKPVARIFATFSAETPGLLCRTGSGVISTRKARTSTDSTTGRERPQGHPGSQLVRRPGGDGRWADDLVVAVVCDTLVVLEKDDRRAQSYPERRGFEPH